MNLLIRRTIGLKRRQAGVVPAREQVADLFERIGHGDWLRFLNRRRRCLEQVIRPFELLAQPFGNAGAAVVRLVGQVSGELMLDLLSQQADVPRPVEDLAVGVGDQRERAAARIRPGVARLAGLVANRLRQVVHRLVDHGVAQRVPQRVLGHQRPCRHRDDRSLAAPALGAGREGHGNADEVKAIAGPIGQVVARVDSPQLIEVIEVVGMLVQNDRRLEGDEVLSADPAVARVRRSELAAEPAAGAGAPRPGLSRHGDRCGWAGRLFREASSKLQPAGFVLAPPDRGVELALEPRFQPFGHLGLVLGSEFGQPVLAPDVGRLDADGAVGRHDPVELVNHLLGRGKTDLFIHVVASAPSRSPRNRADHTRARAVSRAHAGRAGEQHRGQRTGNANLNGIVQTWERPW